jgi:DnaJ-class molecular chaperone
MSRDCDVCKVERVVTTYGFGRVKCEPCGGTGKQQLGPYDQTCLFCNGVGDVRCPKCHGTATLDN